MRLPSDGPPPRDPAPMQPLDEDSLDGATPEEIHAALFLQLITGHAQMALMFLGRIENPQSGTIEPPNLEAAKLFLDQLEMLEVKTRGNLGELEASTLRDTLAVVRETFAGEFDAQLSDDVEHVDDVEPPRGS